jgi:hypothetical protein
MTVIANGDNIVIASNGSIVAVGDNAVLRGNTGDATGSGTIAVDAIDSEISSGNSERTDVVAAPAPGSPSAPIPPGDPPPTSPYPQSASPPPVGGGVVATGATAPMTADRATAIAGYEDHSIDVGGSDNVVTYDDSDVFLHRDGQLNGNTGDTDTSGLNVVDATGSTVLSGDSGNSDESPDPPPFNAGTRPSGSTGAPPPMGGAAASVTDINGVSTAAGQDSLVIGGDGMDDNGVAVRGDRNVVSYDDGNVAIGGTGNVNAQIGDSDTGGTVAMGVHDSHIEAGDSFLPASQQAGAQSSDPFDGDDPDVD